MPSLKVVPHLVQILRTLTTTGYSSDHSIAGVSDPFLQVGSLFPTVSLSIRENWVRVGCILGKGEASIASGKGRGGHLTLPNSLWDSICLVQKPGIDPKIA